MLNATSVIALCVSIAALLAAPAWRRPARDTEWQLQLADEGTITPIKGVEFYAIDMDTAATQIAVLRRSAGANLFIACYISVGTWESYRVDEDLARGISQSDFEGILGKTYAPPFQDERWLDVRSPRTRAIMAKRFDYAKKIGCDGVDPDNTMANDEDTGFNITNADALNYTLWVAEAVHARGMAVGLKNTQSLLPELHENFDWFLNEQCNADDSCGDYSIVGKSKPVFGAEYCDATEAGNGVTLDPGCYCPGVIAAGYKFLIKQTANDAPRVTCEQYCAQNDCPGRRGRDNCDAGEPTVCAAVGI